MLLRCARQNSGRLLVSRNSALSGFHPRSSEAIGSRAQSSETAEPNAVPNEASADTTAQQQDKKQSARLVNAPKYALREEVLGFFSGCHLTTADVRCVLDEKARPKFWQLDFPSVEDFNHGRSIVERVQRMGSRKVKMDRLLPHMDFQGVKDHPNERIDEYRGRTLLMIGVPEDVSFESIDRFFEGFRLAPKPYWHIHVKQENVRTPLRQRLQGERRPSITLVDRRLMVKFRTQAEALRALREKNRAFLEERLVELRLLQ